MRLIYVCIQLDNLFYLQRISRMDGEGANVSEEYNFNHPERGRAIVINNIKFDERTNQPFRKGAENDSENLADTFALLGFDVKVYTNLTTTEMLSVLQQGGYLD